MNDVCFSAWAPAQAFRSALLLACAGFPLVSHADTADAGSSDSGTSMSAQDLSDIEKALAADQKVKTPGMGAAAQEAPRVAPSGGVSLQSLNPDLSFIFDVALAGFSTDTPLQAGGHDPRRNGFKLQQLELAIGSSVDPFFRFDSNIVFSADGVEIEEAYATSLGLPFGLQVRVGKFLTRFGRINNTHPHAWAFVDQPFTFSRNFGGENNRGLGGEASYLVPLPWYVELVGSVTDATEGGATRSFLGDTPDGPPVIHSPFDLQLTFALKQFFELSDDLSLAWGLSAATAPNPTAVGNRSDIYGTDLYLKYRPLSNASFTIVSLQAEVLYRRRQVPEDLLSDVGGYAYLFWRFQPRWAAGARYEYGSVARGRTGIADDYLDPFWTADRHRVSANLTFWPTEFSRIRLQGSRDALGWQAQPNWAVFLTAEFSVGAHGAHAF